jgi:hypothetical protein
MPKRVLALKAEETTLMPATYRNFVPIWNELLKRNREATRDIMAGKSEAVFGNLGGASPNHREAPVDFDLVNNARGVSTDEHEFGE